ncbi:MAG: hemerythrin domain-containing protein [Phycisphaerae bacterium]
MSDPTSDQIPSTVLRQEHQTILRVIAVLESLVERAESAESFNAEALGKCVAFFQLFADACHHAKEEDLLFPVLESRGVPNEGGPIGVMLYEHTVARGLVKQMGQALSVLDNQPDQAVEQFKDAAHKYISLLRQHIDKEDGILFHMADRVMHEEDQRTLCSQFCEVGCRSFGGKTREELQRLADELESRHATS